MRAVGTILLILVTWACPVAAQDHAEHQHAAPPGSASAWTVTTDANVFAGFNYQSRRYFDFAAWESQNWMMATARGAGRDRR
jgi:hypothetical protein